MVCEKVALKTSTILTNNFSSSKKPQPLCVFPSSKMESISHRTLSQTETGDGRSLKRGMCHILLLNICYGRSDVTARLTALH